MRRWGRRWSRPSRSCSAGWWVSVALMAASLQANEVNLGGIVLTVSETWTAQLFHIVDQLSATCGVAAEARLEQRIRAGVLRQRTRGDRDSKRSAVRSSLA